MPNFGKQAATRRLAFFLFVLPLVCARAQAPPGGASSTDVPGTTLHHARTKKKPQKSTNDSDARSSRDGQKRPSKNESSAITSDSEIAAAKSSGKVWVNLDSGIYHKNGRWYGRTKNGKFMTEAEARAAGYKASQRN